MRSPRPPRKLSNEEILLARMRSHGSLDLKVVFLAKDEDNYWKWMSGNDLIVKHIPNAGRLFGIIDRTKKFITENHS